MYSQVCPNGHLPLINRLSYAASLFLALCGTFLMAASIIWPLIFGHLGDRFDCKFFNE
jgi:hypothetical protein